ncbi:MAG: hypothetical protein HRT66_08970, partial [Flavobacteriaceae bacterium]|nr:hypothetical protein [Flavobacteriaceae bacterium]
MKQTPHQYFYLGLLSGISKFFVKANTFLSVKKAILILLLLSFGSGWSQSIFSITNSTNTSVNGSFLKGASGGTYTLVRTFQKGFGNVEWAEGTATGIQARNIQSNNSAIDKFTYQYDVTASTNNFIKGVSIRRKAADTGGTSEWADYTITWTGGGNAIITDPDNFFINVTDGQLVSSGFTLEYAPVSLKVNPNVYETWNIDIASDNVKVAAVATFEGSSDWLYNEWISFDVDVAMNLVLSDHEICAGDNTIITMNSSVIGDSYQLRDGSNNNIGSAMPGTGNAISFMGVSPTVASTYNVLVTSSGGSEELVDKAVVTMKSQTTSPSITAASLCFGTTASELPSWADSTITWYNSSDTKIETGTLELPRG